MPGIENKNSTRLRKLLRFNKIVAFSIMSNTAEAGTSLLNDWQDALTHQSGRGLFAGNKAGNAGSPVVSSLAPMCN